MLCIDFTYYPLCTSASGDMAIPSFFDDANTLDNTVGIPADQADGFMYDFAVNMITLKFLQGTSALDPDAERGALDYMVSSK